MKGLIFENISVQNILGDISFEAPCGKITAVIGKNGSGKTTLLRTVIGDVKYNGRISFSDKDISHISVKERAKLISYMPQMLPAPQITVEELVSFGRSPYSGVFGALGKDDAEKVACAMRCAGISDMKNTRLDALSGGERQSAFLAMLLAQDTPAVMLDEPTAHLDIEKRGALYRVMSSLANDGRAVICVMHDINDALNICDCVALLDKGKLVFYGGVDDFHASGLAKEVFALEKCTLIKNGENCVFYT